METKREEKDCLSDLEKREKFKETVSKRIKALVLKNYPIIYDFESEGLILLEDEINSTVKGISNTVQKLVERHRNMDL